jgi:SAM-dependent methyltransferase
LEVGVGTGQLALPLAAVGIPVTGIDLSPAMLDVLRGKAGAEGPVPVPVAIADATRMPFRDETFGGAYLRWVLHLIDDWRGALTEMVRVVRPGGVVLVLLGGGDDGPRERIQTEFAQRAGVRREPRGLDWHGEEDLDAAMAAFGAARRWLPPFLDEETQTVDAYMEAIARNLYSWTWPLADDVRSRVADEVRVWAEDEFGPLGDLPRGSYQVTWRAYDLP